MLRNITIGQYMARDSIIHNLDPRIKIVITIMMITALFFIDTFSGYGLFFLSVLVIIYLSRIPLIRIIRGLKPVLFLVLLTLILHIFFTRGGEVIWQWGFISIESRRPLYRPLHGYQDYTPDHVYFPLNPHYFASGVNRWDRVSTQSFKESRCTRQ